MGKKNWVFLVIPVIWSCSDSLYFDLDRFRGARKYALIPHVKISKGHFSSSSVSAWPRLFPDWETLSQGSSTPIFWPKPDRGVYLPHTNMCVQNLAACRAMDMRSTDSIGNICHHTKRRRFVAYWFQCRIVWHEPPTVDRLARTPHRWPLRHGPAGSRLLLWPLQPLQSLYESFPAQPLSPRYDNKGSAPRLEVPKLGKMAASCGIVDPRIQLPRWWLRPSRPPFTKQMHTDKARPTQAVDLHKHLPEQSGAWSTSTSFTKIWRKAWWSHVFTELEGASLPEPRLKRIEQAFEEKFGFQRSRLKSWRWVMVLQSRTDHGRQSICSKTAGNSITTWCSCSTIQTL